MSFTDISNQSRAVSLLQSDLESGRVADCYLFIGQDGEAGLEAALEFAKALNCVSSSDPCGICISCKKISSGIHPDVFVLDFESQAQLLELSEDEKARQKDFKIETLRILISRAYLSPAEGKKRIFIIHGAEFLNTESANSLLKVLEESPQYCHWILLSKSSDRVMGTIQSRARRIYFAPPLSREERQIPLNPPLEKGEIQDISPCSPFGKGGNIMSPPLKKGETSVSAILAMAPKILSSDKKLGQRRCAEIFLKDLSEKISQELRLDPQLKTAEKLSWLLRSQEDLRRNVSPQLVLDSLFLKLSLP